MEVREKMYEIVSNYNPLSNLDTSSPKVNHNHVLKVLIHTHGSLFFNLGLATGLLTLYFSPAERFESLC